VKLAKNYGGGDSTNHDPNGHPFNQPSHGGFTVKPGKVFGQQNAYRDSDRHHDGKNKQKSCAGREKLNGGVSLQAKIMFDGVASQHYEPAGIEQNRQREPRSYSLFALLKKAVRDGDGVTFLPEDCSSGVAMR
jgi:hypothetical protein